MKLLESAIAAISPRWAAERAAWRAQLSATRAYDGARGGRRQAGWSRPSTSANGEIGAAGVALRNSARDLVRNHPNAKKAKRSYVANMVGTGIVPRANTGNKRRDKAIDQAFADWCATADADGVLDFFGLQGLVAGTMFESGAVLARYRDRARKAGEIPLKVQLLEPDFIDLTRIGRVGDGSNYINQGVEFTDAGERVAYYLWSAHPGDPVAGLRMQSLKSIRVPIEQLAHVYRVDRPGQIHGVTEYAAGMQKVYDLAEYDEAELVRKKISACFAAFVKRSGNAALPLTEAETDPNGKGKRIETIAPGLVQYLGFDESVEFGEPPTAEGYKEYTAAQWHAIAAGWGLTYEELTGDFSGVNYSSYRAGHNGYRRAISMDQWLLLIPMFCAPTWRRFIDRLVIAGVIGQAHYGVEWECPRFESIDPLKDSIADRNDVRSGFASLPQVIQRRGDNPDKVLDQIAATAKRLDQLGLVLDSDPRRVSSGGQAQTEPKAEQPGEAGGNGGDDAKSE